MIDQRDGNNKIHKIQKIDKFLFKNVELVAK